MKTLFHILLVFGLATCLFSCEQDNENAPTISGKVIEQSSCKNFTKSATVTTPDSVSCIEYSYNAQEQKLSLTHINAGFNCCPDSLFCQISVEGTTITVEELEKNMGCKCNCLYDLKIEIEGVSAGSYQLVFEEPYREEQEQLTFDVNLAKKPEGSVCVTRTQYPWGGTSEN